MLPRLPNPASALLLAAAALCALAGHAAGGDAIGYGELEPSWEGELEHLSWRPRAFVVKRFLSDEECDHIIGIATPRMEESSVLDNKSGVAKKSGVRTSTGTFFGRGHDAVVSAIEKRIAAVTMLPVENQEGLQVLHYTNGQKYDAHYDYFHDDLNQRLENGGQRVLTVLMYLSTPEEGGETVFPDGERKVSGQGWSECALKGLAHKPAKGDALLFYSLSPDGKKDPASLHSSCPTLKGDKWSATKWIHVAPFGVPHPAAAQDSSCADEGDACPEWAHMGECERNPTYMLRSCRKSCKVCDPAKTNTGRVIDVPVKTV